MLFILIAAQVAANAVPPRPVVVQVPMPPPVYIPTPSYSREAVKFIVEIEVRGGGTLLWSGPLRVGGGGTSVRREQTEPGDAACAQGDSASPVTTSFSLTLYNRGRDGTVTVNVRWSRPGEQPCGPGPNTRTVELAATADLSPGGATVLTGDGGLTVRLRRR